MTHVIKHVLHCQLLCPFTFHTEYSELFQWGDSPTSTHSNCCCSSTLDWTPPLQQHSRTTAAHGLQFDFAPWNSEAPTTTTWHKFRQPWTLSPSFSPSWMTLHIYYILILCTPPHNNNNRFILHHCVQCESAATLICNWIKLVNGPLSHLFVIFFPCQATSTAPSGWQSTVRCSPTPPPSTTWSLAF